MKIDPGFTIEDDDLDLQRQFTAYVREVVKYARYEYFRKLKYHGYEIPLDDAPDDVLIYEDPPPASNGEFDFTEEKLSKAFSGLKSLRREILTLIFAEGLSAQETADRLGCSVDQVYLQKHRTLKALRDQLMEEGDADVK